MHVSMWSIKKFAQSSKVHTKEQIEISLSTKIDGLGHRVNLGFWSSCNHLQTKRLLSSQCKHFKTACLVLILLVYASEAQISTCLSTYPSNLEIQARVSWDSFADFIYATTHSKELSSLLFCCRKLNLQSFRIEDILRPCHLIFS